MPQSYNLCFVKRWCSEKILGDRREYVTNTYSVSRGELCCQALLWLSFPHWWWKACGSLTDEAWGRSSWREQIHCSQTFHLTWTLLMSQGHLSWILLRLLSNETYRGSASAWTQQTSSQCFLPPHACGQERIKYNKSTTKLRVVFDASAKSSSGLSLNNILLVSPTVHSTLIDVLLHFRQHHIALTTDIIHMYGQLSSLKLTETYTDLCGVTIWTNHLRTIARPGWCLVSLLYHLLWTYVASWTDRCWHYWGGDQILKGTARAILLCWDSY